jgi:hypothetical protein
MQAIITGSLADFMGLWNNTLPGLNFQAFLCLKARFLRGSELDGKNLHNKSELLLVAFFVRAIYRLGCSLVGQTHCFDDRQVAGRAWF